MRSALDATRRRPRRSTRPRRCPPKIGERLAALGYVGTQRARRPSPGDVAAGSERHGTRLRRIARRSTSSTPGNSRRRRRARQVLDDNPGMIDVWLHYAAVEHPSGPRRRRLHGVSQAMRRKPEEQARCSAPRPAPVAGPAGRGADSMRNWRSRARPPAHTRRSPTSRSRRSDSTKRSVRPTWRAGRSDAAAARVRPRHDRVQPEAIRRGPAAPARRRARARPSGPRPAERSALLLGDSLARLERYQEAEPFFSRSCVSSRRTRAPAPVWRCSFKRRAGRTTSSASSRTCCASRPNPAPTNRAGCRSAAMFGRAGVVRAAVRGRGAARGFGG